MFRNKTDWPGFIIALSIIAFVLGIALVLYARSEGKLADDAKTAPEEITLKKLIARGPNGNNNIILTNYVICENGAYESKNGSWTCAWVPIVPSENVPPGQPNGGSPSVIHAIIESPKARNKNDLEQRCMKTRLQGMVVNKINTLSSSARDILEARYTGTNFDTCLIIEEGREPSSQGHIQVVRLLGIILIPVGVAGCFIAGYLKVSGPRVRSRRLRRDEDRPIRRRRDAEDDDSGRRRQRERSDDDEPRTRSRHDEDDRDEERSSRRRDDDDREEPPPPRRRRDDDDDRASDRRSEGIDPETGRHRRRRRDDD